MNLCLYKITIMFSVWGSPGKSRYHWTAVIFSTTHHISREAVIPSIHATFRQTHSISSNITNLLFFIPRLVGSNFKVLSIGKLAGSTTRFRAGQTVGRSEAFRASTVVLKTVQSFAIATSVQYAAPQLARFWQLQSFRRYLVSELIPDSVANLLTKPPSMIYCQECVSWIDCSTNQEIRFNPGSWKALGGRGESYHHVRRIARYTGWFIDVVFLPAREMKSFRVQLYQLARNLGLSDQLIQGGPYFAYFLRDFVVFWRHATENLENLPKSEIFACDFGLSKGWVLFVA